MQKVTAQQVLSSFINASRSEAARLTLPRDFEELNWDRLDFLTSSAAATSGQNPGQ